MKGNSKVSAGIGKGSGKTKRQTPEKPRADFPLWPHPNGQWCRKIRGKPVYFGVWADPKATRATYLDQRDDLMAGRTPRVSCDGLSVCDLFNRFLNAKRHMAENQELSNRSCLDYLATSKIIAGHPKGRFQATSRPTPYQQVVIRHRLKTTAITRESLYEASVSASSLIASETSLWTNRSRQR